MSTSADDTLFVSEHIQETYQIVYVCRSSLRDGLEVAHDALMATYNVIFDYGKLPGLHKEINNFELGKMVFVGVDFIIDELGRDPAGDLLPTTEQICDSVAKEFARVQVVTIEEMLGTTYRDEVAKAKRAAEDKARAKAERDAAIENAKVQVALHGGFSGTGNHIPGAWTWGSAIVPDE